MGQRTGTLVGVVVLCLAAVVGPGPTMATGGPPVAEAGLDQRVEQNTTVYLNAGGSFARAGSLRSYWWIVIKPNGTTLQPACPSCERTQFRPADTGVYEVTVTVTDTVGRSASDTLYVNVTDSDPPEVRLASAGRVPVGRAAPVIANVTAGEDPVSWLRWRVDGQLAERVSLGSAGTRTTAVRFSSSGTYTVSAVVGDELGRTDTASTEITVVSSSAGSRSRGESRGLERSRGDTRPDFAMAGDEVTSFDDITFNNYADGDLAVIISRRHSDGKVVLVNQREAQKLFHPGNWGTVRLSTLVDSDTVSRGVARRILRRMQQRESEPAENAVATLSGTEDQTPDGPIPSVEPPTQTDSTNEQNSADVERRASPPANQADSRVPITSGSGATVSSSSTQEHSDEDASDADSESGDTQRGWTGGSTGAVLIQR